MLLASLLLLGLHDTGLSAHEDQSLLQSFGLRLQNPISLLDSGIVSESLSFLALFSLLSFFLAAHFY